jgi:cystathionine beta-synthase
MMKDRDISQMPVMEGDEIIGSITETTVLNYLLENPMNNSENRIESILEPAFPMVEVDLPCKQLSKYFSKKTPAVIAKDKAGMLHILTQYDIIQAV